MFDRHSRAGRGAGDSELMHSAHKTGLRPALWATSVFIVAAVGAMALISLVPARPWEDHFQIALNFRNEGALVVDGVHAIFRPPGFPVLFGSFLTAWDAASTGLGARLDATAALNRLPVFHSLLLGAMAVAIFAVSKRGVPLFAAALTSLALTLNPLTLSIAIIATYHLTFLVAVTVVMAFVVVSPAGGLLTRRFGEGLAWGAVALVKPVALAYPAYLLLLPGLGIWKRVRTVMAVALGVVTIIAPLIAYNWLRVGEPILTSQGGFALWGTSVEAIPDDDSFLNWQSIWFKHGMQIYAAVTGEDEYSQTTFNRESIPLNRAFGAAALRNIAEAPHIYLNNVLRNSVSFSVSSMQFWPALLPSRNKDKLLFNMVAAPFIYMFISLSVLGGVIGLLMRSGDAIHGLLLLLAVIGAHAISFATELYTIAKYPALAVLFCVFVSTMYAALLRRTHYRLLGVALPGAMLLWGVLASAVMLR